MARSMTIQQEEKASTSPLLTGFILLAVAWMAVAALMSGDADAANSPSASPSQATSVQDLSHAP